MSRWILFLAGCAALTISGCAVMEQEQRPSAGTSRRPSAPAPAPATQVAANPPKMDPSTAPAIYADSAILIDAITGETIYEKNADQRRQVASTQKLLTALLVAERGGLDEYVTVTAADAAVEPTNVGFMPGQKYTRRQLLTAMLVKSCNDAASALGRDYAGSIEAFSAAMDAKARELGAYSSHFVNPSGLPGPQFSTARDMARIAYAAWRKPELRAIMRMPAYRFVFNSGRSKYLESTNKLLGRVPGVDGMKTGFTYAAGRCLVTSATINGRSYILVQLGSKTQYIFNDAENMLAWASSRSQFPSFLANR